MEKMMRAVLSVLALATLSSGPADAYVRSRTDRTQSPLVWTRRCIPFHIHEAGSDNLALGVVVNAIKGSFEAWQIPECSGVEFHYQGLTNDPRVGYLIDGDNINNVVWRETAWPPERNAVIALTTVTFCDQQGGACNFAGEILDADIELNGVEFKFSATVSPVGQNYDIRNTVTHEVGHMLGLDHSPVSDATMFSTAPAGERSKATLFDDDIEGLCDIYPVPDGTPACESFEVTGEHYLDLDEIDTPTTPRRSDDSCRATPGGAGEGPAPWLLGLLLGWAMRRRLRGAYTAQS
jgi:hypothetical protein